MGVARRPCFSIPSTRPSRSNWPAAAARSAGLVCHVPFTYRYMPTTHYVKRLLEEGSTDFARTIAYYEMAHNLAEMEEDLDRALVKTAARQAECAEIATEIRDRRP